MANKKATKPVKTKYAIKKGDKVMAISGDDKGKTGIVIQMLPSEHKAVVEGFRIVKKHVKATQTSEGGIQEIEAPMHISNLMLVDPKTGQPTRVKRSMVNGDRVRVSKKSGEIIL
jgi:large subunit ribosomal protein L24